MREIVPPKREEKSRGYFLSRCYMRKIVPPSRDKKISRGETNFMREKYSIFFKQENIVNKYGAS